MKKQYQQPYIQTLILEKDVVTQSDLGTGDIYGDDWQDGTIKDGGILTTGWTGGSISL